MIVVSYDPFTENSGTIYYIKNNKVEQKISNLPASLTRLANSVSKFAHGVNDFEIQFQTQFPEDTKEFIEFIKTDEITRYGESKIEVKEIK